MCTKSHSLQTQGITVVVHISMPATRRPWPAALSLPPLCPSQRCTAPGPCGATLSSARACRRPSSFRGRPDLGCTSSQTRKRSLWPSSAQHQHVGMVALSTLGCFFFVKVVAKVTSRVCVCVYVFFCPSSSGLGGIHKFAAHVRRKRQVLHFFHLSPCSKKTRLIYILFCL